MKDFGFQEHLKVQQVLVKPVTPLVNLVKVHQEFVLLVLMNMNWMDLIVYQFIELR